MATSVNFGVAFLYLRRSNLKAVTSLSKTHGDVLSWKNDMFPLVVLFSPNLRLRFRVSWVEATEQVNEALERLVFLPPKQTTHSEACLYEIKHLDVPYRTVYVCDENGPLQEGKITPMVIEGVIQGAMVVLPDFESDPMHTHGVTIHEVGKLMGLVPTDCPCSVMFWDLINRPQKLQEKDVLDLKNIYQ